MALDAANWRWSAALLALALAVGLRATQILGYRDDSRVLSAVGLRPGRRADYYLPQDPVLAPLPFVWTWLEILAISLAAGALRWWPADLLAAVLIAGRFRALQEIGHIAVHFGLCRSRRLQEGLTNLFFQFPIMKRSFRSRRQIHCFEHHRHPNVPGKDPNLARLVAAGMVPGLTPFDFWRKLLHPLGPRGMASTFTAIWAGVTEAAPAKERWARAAAVGLVLALFALTAGARGVTVHYLAALLVFYPWFSWLSLLTEHRWFAATDASDRVAMECTACRPTRFIGFSGAVVSLLIMPYSDRYHLAHSLYPFVRWNHLPAVDRALRRTEARYARHGSTGLLFASPAGPAALSELRERLCGRRQDLADWAMTLAARR